MGESERAARAAWRLETLRVRLVRLRPKFARVESRPAPAPAAALASSSQNGPYLGDGVGAAAIGDLGGRRAEGGDGGDDLGGVGDGEGLVLEGHGANGEGKDGGGELHFGGLCGY